MFQLFYQKSIRDRQCKKFDIIWIMETLDYWVFILIIDLSKSWFCILNRENLVNQLTNVEKFNGLAILGMFSIDGFPLSCKRVLIFQ